MFDPLVRQPGWHFMWLQEACSLRGFGTAFLGRDILHEHRDNELVKLAATCTGDETNVPPLQFCLVQACGVLKAKSIEDHTIEDFDSLQSAIRHTTGTQDAGKAWFYRSSRWVSLITACRLHGLDRPRT